MVREFKLINEKGQEYSLMDIYNHIFLADPSGLGYSYETEYEQLGNTFITNLRRLERGQIEGTALFLEYDNFKEFVDFVETAESLKFSYKIPYQGRLREYFKDVQIQSVTKTQKQTDGTFSETVVFDCLSLWYEETMEIYNIEPQENELRWNFKWDSKFVDYDTRNLNYINNGHTDAAIEVEMEGYLKNPRIELYIEGDLYQTVTFNTEIDEFEKLLYGTKENEFYINKRKTDGTLESLFSLDVIDFYNDNVIRLPQGRSCELRLKAENEVLYAKIKIYTYYKAV